MHIPEAGGSVPVLATQWSHHKAQHSLDRLGLRNNTFTVVEGWGGRASKEKAARNKLFASQKPPAAKRPSPSELLAPPCKRFGAWQGEAQRALAGHGSAKIEIS